MMEDMNTQDASVSSLLDKTRFFLLSGVIILADQITKALVVSRIPLGTIARKMFGDVLYIVHVRNKAIAFSLGDSLPDMVKAIFFVILPLAVLGFLAYWMVRKDSEFTVFQKWVVAGIIGGGVGNLIDRIFRPEGVVDFISVVFPFFGMERWPTFNVADSTVVVCGILLFLSLLFMKDGGELKGVEEKENE